MVEIAAALDVPVSQLLGMEAPPETENDLANELAEVNELLAKKSRQEKLYRQANRQRELILFFSFAAMASLFGDKKPLISVGLIIACLIMALVILYRNLTLLANAATHFDKRALRLTTIVSIIFLLLAAGLAALDNLAPTLLAASQEEILSAAILMAIILLAGWVSPRLPFNRYTGLRLPWTIRDEDTWRIAHRILAYLALPVVFLYAAAIGTTDNLEAATIITVLLWLGIPSFLSFIFYWRKTH